MTIKDKEAKRCVKCLNGLLMHITKFVIIRENFEKKGLQREWNETIDMCIKRYRKALGVDLSDFADLLKL